jgi:hypothetical protein
MEEYNFNPKTYNDFYKNAEFIVRKFLNFEDISDYNHKKHNVAIYHTITIDKNNYKTIDDIRNYFSSKPTAQKDMDISDYIELKKKQEITT